MAKKKLFIGGLSWDTTDESLKTAFSKFGDVEYVKVIIDRETQRSKGFGFVTFYEEDDANKAMSKMDGAEVDGRNIRVKEAIEKPRSEHKVGGGGYRRDDGPVIENRRGGYNDDRGRDRGDRWDGGGGKGSRKGGRGRGGDR